MSTTAAVAMQPETSRRVVATFNVGGEHLNEDIALILDMQFSAANATVWGSVKDFDLDRIEGGDTAEPTTDQGLYLVALRKGKSAWYYQVRGTMSDGRGGVAGSVPAKGSAVARALRSIPDGARYLVITNGTPGLEQRRGLEG